MVVIRAAVRPPRVHLDPTALVLSPSCCFRVFDVAFSVAFLVKMDMFHALLRRMMIVDARYYNINLRMPKSIPWISFSELIPFHFILSVRQSVDLDHIVKEYVMCACGPSNIVICFFNSCRAAVIGCLVCLYMMTSDRPTSNVNSL